MTTQRPENTENKNYRQSVIQNIGIIQCEAPDKNLYKKNLRQTINSISTKLLRKPTKTIQMTVDTRE